MKRGEAGKKTAKSPKMAMGRRRTAAGPERTVTKMASKVVRKMPGDMSQDMKVCEKPHDMEHYRLSDEDDACFDSTR
jgi:hypothetical protein